MPTYLKDVSKEAQQAIGDGLAYLATGFLKGSSYNTYNNNENHTALLSVNFKFDIATKGKSKFYNSRGTHRVIISMDSYSNTEFQDLNTFGRTEKVRVFITEDEYESIYRVNMANCTQVTDFVKAWNKAIDIVKAGKTNLTTAKITVPNA